MFLTKKIIDLLFPISCLGCGQLDTWVCRRCAERVCSATSSVRGQLLFRQYLSRVYAFADYHDPLVAQIVSTFKYQFAKDIGNRLGELMVEQLMRRLSMYPEIQFDAVVPVPLAARRERWRGFNQSVTLALAMSSRCGWPLELAAIRRTRFTELQTMLASHRRRQNILQAFKVIHPSRVAGKRILLVDDVITTGATCNECAKILLRAGASDVWAVAFARG